MVSTQLWANFPQQIHVGDNTLIKNGEGERIYKSFFKNVLIYSSALYLESKKKDPDAILESSGEKVLKIIYHYEVGREDAIKAWRESFKKNCKKECQSLQPEIERFLKSVKDSSEKTKRTYYFLSDQMRFEEQGDKIFVSKNKNFSKLLLSTWIGDVPPTEELKKSLLGVEK